MGRAAMGRLDKAMIEKLVQVVAPNIAGDFKIIAEKATGSPAADRAKKESELLDKLQKNCQDWFNELVRVMSGTSPERYPSETVCLDEDKWPMDDMTVIRFYVNSRQHYPIIVAIRNYFEGNTRMKKLNGYVDEFLDILTYDRGGGG